jgi:hypothetical protein
MERSNELKEITMPATFKVDPTNLAVTVMTEGLVAKRDLKDTSVPPFADIMFMEATAQFSAHHWEFTAVDTVEAGLAIYPQAVDTTVRP